MTLRDLCLAASAFCSIAAYAEGADNPAPLPTPAQYAEAWQVISAASTVLAAAKAQDEACWDALRKSPDFKPLLTHIPARNQEPTPEQLDDKSFVTPEEAQALRTIEPEGLACKAIFQEVAIKLVPAMGPIDDDDDRKHAIDVADLIAHKLTWGQYEVRTKVLRADTGRRRAAERDRTTHLALAAGKSPLVLP